MSGPFFARLKAIVESHQVSAAADAAAERFPRFDDAWNAFKWLLARSADQLGLAASIDGGLRLYVQDGDGAAGAPVIRSVFRVQANEIELIEVEFSEAIDDDSQPE